MPRNGISLLALLKSESNGSTLKSESGGNSSHFKGGRRKRFEINSDLRSRQRNYQRLFDAHCIDSWCLAHHTVGGDGVVDNASIFCISPLPIQRRALHREQPKKGGIRSRYGGTVLANGLIKHTLVKHVKHGLTRLAGMNAKGLFAIY